MALLSLLSGLFIFTLIVAILYPAGQKIERQNRRLHQIEGAYNNKIDEDLSRPFTERFLIPIFYSVLHVVVRLFPKTNKGNSLLKLERELKIAGIKLSVREFSAMRFIIMFSCIGFSLLSLIIEVIPLKGKAFIILFGVILSILIPRYYLQASIKKRQEGIRQQMPDILDLLSVSIEAGLGFDAALIRVSDRATGPLVDELVTVYREMQMGRPRREALKDLAERSNISELKMFAGAMVQADQLGISIKNVLKAQSQQLRHARKQRAEEKAMKAPVKMMLPLIIFIFPVVFIILLGPSVVEIIRTFNN